MKYHRFIPVLSVVIILLFSGCSRQDRQSESEAAAAATGTNAIKASDGARLTYVIEGKGIPCFVIGFSGLYQKTLSQNLRNNLQLVFTEFRYMYNPETPPDLFQVTRDTLVFDIEEIRSHLGMDKIALMGPAAQGWLVLEYARRFPQHATHVILVGTPLSFWDEDYWDKVTKFWESDADDERKAILQRNRSKLTNDVLSRLTPGQGFVLGILAETPRYFFDPNYDPGWLWEGIEVNMDVYNHIYNQCFRGFDIREGFSDLQVPVFAAIGRYDAPIYLPWSENLDSLPGITFHLFEKSGHYPMLEEQELFDKLLLDWISGS